MMILVKTSNYCNMDCKYCFISEKNRKKADLPMVLELLRKSCKFYSEHDREDRLLYIWQGGEPLLMGKEFFERVRAEQKNIGGINIRNTIQTNGTLLDEGWISFLRKNGFVIRLSLDGPKDIHDRNRVFRNNGGTFEKVIENIKALKKYQDNVLTLTMVTSASIGNAKRIYDFFREQNINFRMQPFCKLGNARKNYEQIAITPEEYGNFLIEMFDLYFHDRNRKNFIADFESAIECYDKMEGISKVSKMQSDPFTFAMDYEGDIYLSIILTFEEFRQGNIMSDSFEDVIRSGKYKKMRKRRFLLEKCRGCKWLKICRGGRCSCSFGYYNDYFREDYFCNSFMMFYEHLEKVLGNAKSDIN